MRQTNLLPSLINDSLFVALGMFICPSHPLHRHHHHPHLLLQIVNDASYRRSDENRCFNAFPNPDADTRTNPNGPISPYGGGVTYRPEWRCEVTQLSAGGDDDDDDDDDQTCKHGIQRFFQCYRGQMVQFQV